MVVPLKNSVPLASGASRAVYVHPSDPDLLIKVMRPEFLAARRAATTWRHRFKPARMLSIFIREIREQIILISRGEDTEAFMERVIGFCDTDLGLGMVVRAVRDGDRYGRTLGALIKEGGFDAAARRDLGRFCAAILTSDIVLSSLPVRNIVYGRGPDGARRFVIVDAFGEGALFPWKGAFPSLNRRLKKRRVQRLLWQVDVLAGRRRDRHSGGGSRATGSEHGATP